MITYIYKGEWKAESYEKNIAVKYNGSYYRTIIEATVNDIPGIDTNVWEELSAFSYESTSGDKMNYNNLKELANPIGLLNDNGLYRFPDKEALDSDIDKELRHFYKMGVQMMYEFAKEYYDDNKEHMPKITGIYVVQGERKKNIVTQGFSIAAVEAVGFHINFNSWYYYNNPAGYNFDQDVNMTQSTKIGNNNNDVAFPILGGSDYRLFPVIKLTRGRNDKNKPIWRMEEDSTTELLVVDKGDVFSHDIDMSYQHPNSRFAPVFRAQHSYSLITPNRMSEDQKLCIQNIKTNKFCIYTPDILLDRSIRISSNLYVSPIKKVKRVLGETLSSFNSSMDVGAKVSSFAHMAKKGLNNGRIYSRTGPSDGYYGSFPQSILYFPKYNMIYEANYHMYKNIDSGQSVYKVNASVIQENQIYSNYGFSTRMKSIIEVFGYDYKTGKKSEQASTITAFMNASRNQLYDAGVMINRTKRSVNDNEVEKPAIIGVDVEDSNDTLYKKYPFGFQDKFVLRFEEDNLSNSLPVVATNHSMRSLPYIGVVRDEPGKYSSVSAISTPASQMGDSGYIESFSKKDYRNLHNTIVNLCIYRNLDEYRDAVHNSFNLLSEQYRVIDYRDSYLANENLVRDSLIIQSSNLEAFAHRQVMLKEGVQYTLSANGNAKNAKNGKRLRVIIYNNNLSPRLEEYLDITTSENSISSVTFMGREGLATIATFYSDRTEPRDGSVTINWYKLEEGDTFTGYNESEHIFRGDVFSQKTFMRVIRWDNLPDIMVDREEGTDWSYTWKFAQAFNLYLQSFTNSYLRVPDHESMYYPYVKTLFSSISEAVENFLWKNTSMRYLKETWRTNDGYNITHGLWSLSPYSDLLMKRSYLAPNRIYASNKHTGGALVDQYRSFPTGQYRDYNFEGGDIMRLIKFHDTLFTIQKYSINQHFPSRELAVADDSSTIITGDRGVLNDFTRRLETYGTFHKESVVSGVLGIYGVDWEQEKIWRIKMEYGAEGGVFYLVENLIESKMAYDLFKFIKTRDELPQDLYGDEQTGIISTHDEENKQILFTFHLGIKDGVKEYYTIAFSEEIDGFIGFLGYYSNFYIKKDNRLLSFAWGTNNNSELWEHNKGEYLDLYGTKEDMVLRFIVNGLSEEQSTAQFEKEFQSHIINSSHEEFDVVSWETEWQESKKDPFINKDHFWSNPEYREHTWRVPIMPNQKDPADGPLGSNTFSTFEVNSAMKGQWLKVTLRYRPKGNKDVQFFIKNIITNFLISYS